MKLSNSYFYTLRENPKDEDSVSVTLLVRAGFIKKVRAGIYMFMPNGSKTLSKIEGIIKEEMDIGLLGFFNKFLLFFAFFCM